jgi:WD40 repeat protein
MIPVAGRGITRRDALRLGLGVPIAWAGACATASRGDDVAEKPSKRIYFYGELSLGTGRHNGTFAIDPESGTWVRITTEGNHASQVSPDGRWLAFSRYVQEGKKQRGLWVCDTLAQIIHTLLGRTGPRRLWCRILRR